MVAWPGLKPDAGQGASFERQGRSSVVPRVAAVVLVAVMITMGPVGTTYGQSGVFTFASWHTYNAGSETTGIDSGDFNGDGHIDLVVSNRATNNVSILLSAGDGTFLPQQTIAVGNEPRYVVAADFDGDCDLDLATVDRQSDQVSILFNDGGAGFAINQTLSLFTPDWLISCDIDGDDDSDVVVTHWDAGAATPSSSPARVTVLINDGTGALTPNTGWPVGVQPRGGDVADIDGDGQLDIVINNLVSDDLTVLLLGPNVTLKESRTIPVGDGPRYVATGDLDHDNDVDLAVIHKSENTLWVLTNDGTGLMTLEAGDLYATQGNPHSVMCADLDGDDVPEVIVSHMAALAIDVYGNNGAGAFTVTSVYSPSGVPHAAAPDLDGDGMRDLATANFNGTLRVHVNLTLSAAVASCPGDANRDGLVGIADFLAVLSTWGECCEATADGCAGDVVVSGEVGVSDFLQVLAAWGACP